TLFAGCLLARRMPDDGEPHHVCPPRARRVMSPTSHGVAPDADVQQTVIRVVQTVDGRLIGSVGGRACPMDLALHRAPLCGGAVVRYSQGSAFLPRVRCFTARAVSTPLGLLSFLSRLLRSVLSRTGVARRQILDRRR